MMLPQLAQVCSGPMTPSRDAWSIPELLDRGTPAMREALGLAPELRLQVLLRVLPEPVALDGPWPMSAVSTLVASASTQAPYASWPGDDFRVDAEYVYPASTIKLGAAVTALQTLAELRAAASPADRASIHAHAPLRYGACFTDERDEDRDESNLDTQRITIAHDIRRIALVSDNPAHNRLYTFTGHRDINQRLWRLGLPSARINHRLARPDVPLDDNRRTGAVELLDTAGGRVVAQIPSRTSDLQINNQGIAGLTLGSAHIDPLTNARIDAPMDFTRRNRLGLRDLQRLLLLVVRPDLLGLPGLPGVDEPDRLLLCDALWPTPGASSNPVYDAVAFPDHHVKWLLPGLLRVAPAADFATFNKVGRAFGFTIENAFVVHRSTRRAFVLTASIYTNDSGVLNADSYDYPRLADPFFADLGEAIARRLWAAGPT
jgi:hypothetical protein